MHQELTHPTITHTERTGYPYGLEEHEESGHECQECGYVVLSGEEYHDVHGDIVCTECTYSYLAGHRQVAA